MQEGRNVGETWMAKKMIWCNCPALHGILTHLSFERDHPAVMRSRSRINCSVAGVNVKVKLMKTINEFTNKCMGPVKFCVGLWHCIN